MSLCHRVGANMIERVSLILLVTLFPLATPVTSAAFAQDAIQLEQMLSKDEQAQLGISTMPPEKRAAMRGALIRMYQQGYRTAKGAGQPSAGSGTGAIETQIDGEFNGWEGETVVKLLNGQIWQ